MKGRVFVAGAHGVIGRRLVPQLLSAGFHVTGTTRSPDTAARLRALGIDAVVVNIYDATRLKDALIAASPDAVIHQLTDLPANPDPAQAADYAARNAHLRRIGTAHLVSAAAEAGARQLIAQSIAWVYAPGDTIRTEQEPLDLAATGTRAVSVGGVVALESQVLGSPTTNGVVLRYGALYGPDTGATEARPGMPAVHVDAAARAAVLALHATARGIYNIVDPGPAVSNPRACRELGWDPAFRIV